MTNNSPIHIEQNYSILIDTSQPEHPWTQFAGMFRHDPQFEDMLKDIQTYRQEIEMQEEK